MEQFAAIPTGLSVRAFLLTRLLAGIFTFLSNLTDEKEKKGFSGTAAPGAEWKSCL